MRGGKKAKERKLIKNSKLKNGARERNYLRLLDEKLKILIGKKLIENFFDNNICKTNIGNEIWYFQRIISLERKFDFK